MISIKALPWEYAADCSTEAIPVARRGAGEERGTSSPGEIE
jgi:hypothetical protein